MRPRLHVSSVTAAHPRAAATDVSVNEHFPRNRRATYLWLAWNDQPGLMPDSTLSAVAWQGLAEPALPSAWPLGSRRAWSKLTGTLASPLCARKDRRRFSFAVPEFPRPARVPQEWLGTNACFVAPGVHQAWRQASGRSRWIGPHLGAALSLARACELDGPPLLLARAGARLASELFAATSLLVDLRQWKTLPLTESVELRPERYLSTPDLGHFEHLCTLDRWLESKLQLRPRPSPAIALTGVANHQRPWPAATFPSADPPWKQRKIPARIAARSLPHRPSLELREDERRALAHAAHAAEAPSFASEKR